jgi:hypothetical protein
MIMELYDIPGLLPYKTEIISLDEFFTDGKGKKEDGEPLRWVKVRPFPPYTAAQIESLNTEGIEIHADKQKTTKIKTDADTRMKIRELTLGAGVEDHNICDASGKKLPWDKKLWKSLDRNPDILKKVIRGINRVNPVGSGEDSENPI